jgi:hypothetical protein
MSMSACTKYCEICGQAKMAALFVLKKSLIIDFLETKNLEHCI